MNSNFTNILRIILGIGLIVFGLNKFIQFMPLPDLSAHAANFMNSLRNTGYMLQIVGLMEILIGICLLVKRWVPFALLLLAPISVNILMFHLFLDLPGIVGALIVFVINGILIYKYWRTYRPLFQV